MQVELVKTRTSEGLRLDAALQTPAQAATRTFGFDGAILLSGVGSNFYGSSLIEHLADWLTAAGVAALRVNTRGHDGISTASTAAGGQLQGAAYEIVDECRYDIAAWIDFMVERGFERVVLIGHSLGALKVLYAQAKAPHDSVHQIVALSAPRLSYQDFRVGEQSGAFLESMTTAQQWISQGQPRMLFLASFPFPMMLSAATFVDKYGPSNRYNFLRFATRISCPLLFVYGAQELTQGNVAFAELPNAIAALDWPTVSPPVVLIPQANHLYVGCLQQLTDQLKSHLK